MAPMPQPKVQGANRRQPEIRLLTVPEVSEQLRVATSKVWSLIYSGELPVVRIGRSVRVDQTDLARYVTSRKEAS